MTLIGLLPPHPQRPPPPNAAQQGLSTLANPPESPAPNFLPGTQSRSPNPVAVDSLMIITFCLCIIEDNALFSLKFNPHFFKKSRSKKEKGRKRQTQITVIFPSGWSSLVNN